MIRLAFTQIGGRSWMGGLNYQINLLSILLTYQQNVVTPVLFLGDEVDPVMLERLNRIEGLEIVHSPIFSGRSKLRRLIISLTVGCDYQALKLFKKRKIDIVFEAASFYGWRFPLNCIAWIPDLQHLKLRHYFSFFAFWKRELGFRMQMLAGRHIMLSSEDAKKDFLRFYSISQDRLHVVRFAVPIIAVNSNLDVLLNKYGLPAKFFFLPNQFWKHKNHECVIRALAIALSQGEAFTVAVSGNQNDPRDRDYFPTLLKLAKDFGVEDYFKTLGLIPYEDVQSLMSSSVALINPSRFEGWSTTVEEAKSLGVDMILSDISVHREQAGEAANYFDVDSPETLAALMKSYTKRSQIDKSKQASLAAEQADKRLINFSDSFTKLVRELV